MKNRTFLLLLPALLLGCLTQCSDENKPRRMLATDNDHDLVWDTPKEDKHLSDPKTLVFAYTPVEDPAVYRDVWQGFIDHLSAKTGKPVEFFPVQSNSAQLIAMKAGRLHVTGFNTGSVPIAVERCGFVPFAMMAREDGSFGYEMEIIVPADSAIQKPEDLRGKQLAFTSKTSNSGFKAPSALLKSKFNLIAEKDFTPAYSGAHDTSILGVVNHDYEAAAVANSVLKRMIARKQVDASKIRSIYKSETFPTTAYGYAYNLRPELQEKIREAFFSFDWKGSALEKEFSQSGEAKFIPITYKEHWQVIRDIDKANNVIYEIGE